MDKLHIKLIDHKNIEPKEGQCDGFMCSNKESITHCPSFGINQILPQETLDSLDELGEVLKSIRERMYNEGYEIVDGIVNKVKR